MQQCNTAQASTLSIRSLFIALQYCVCLDSDDSSYKESSDAASQLPHISLHRSKTSRAIQLQLQASYLLSHNQKDASLFQLFGVPDTGLSSSCRLQL